MKDTIEIEPSKMGVSHFVPTGLGQLHVVDIGTGSETVVLWPSIFTDHQIYDELADRLGNFYRFLLIDGPGHGRSEGPVQGFTMVQCAHTIEAVMDAFDLEAAIVGGTSWGGLAAAELALISPERVKAVVLMNTPMEIDERSPKLSARMIAAGARWILGTSVFRRGVAKNFFSDTAMQANPRYSRHFHDMLRSVEAAPLAAAVRSVLLRGKPLKDRLSGLAMPVLVIAGKADPMYPIEDQAHAASLAPNGRFEPVNGKHISVLEEPVTVAEILQDFAREVFASQ
jgi:3-oxoadipate enol-lactonase